MDDWRTYVDVEKEKALGKIIQEENLNPEKTEKFVQRVLRDGDFKTTGTAIDKILPPMRRFDGTRTKRKLAIIERLKSFFEIFLGVAEIKE